MFESYWSAGHNEKALKPEIPPAFEQNWVQPFKYLRDTTMLSVWHWCCEFVIFFLGIIGPLFIFLWYFRSWYEGKQIKFLNKKSHHPIKKYGNAKIILVMNYCVFFMSKNEIRFCYFDYKMKTCMTKQTTKYFSQIFFPDYCCTNTFFHIKIL